MRFDRAHLLGIVVLGLGVAGAGGFAFAEPAPVSKLVQKACGSDYHKYCDQYGLGTTALRMCMDKAGRNLTKGCVSALIKSGEVSQAEVDRRKQQGR
jgi:hypothetical protein